MELGEWLAIGCALNWAISVIIFKKLNTQVDPLEVNFLKNLLGFVLLLITLYAVEKRIYFPLEQKYLWSAFLSGLIGIGVADGLFLVALRRIEASQMAFVECLYSPSVVLASHLLLGERLTPWQYVGGAMIISAVGFARGGAQNSPAQQKNFAGLFIGATSMVMMGLGVSMLKPLFPHMPLFYLITLRLFAGLLVSGLIMILMNLGRRPLTTFLASRQKKLIIAGSFFATYVSMIFWVAGFKYSDASIIAVLNQTSTIFTILLAALFLNERLTVKKVLATMLAFIGVVIINYN